MKSYQYIIIGGGMTGDAAVRGIRSRDTDGSIGLFSQESHPPYNRPPLSKNLWTGMKEEKIWRQTESQNIDLYLSTEVTAINPEKKEISTSDDKTFSYTKLLLATGGTPAKLPESPDGVMYYRTLDDYKHLRALSDAHESFLVIGGGFIGSEISAALANQGNRVSVIFPETGIGGLVFPAELSAYLNQYYADHGVEVLAGDVVESIDGQSGNYTVQTREGKTIQAETIVAGLGIRPNTGLAKSIGLDIDNGIKVDEYLRTSNPDIYAAGDVARFYNPDLGHFLRVEHEENANIQGMTAGQNMAGAEDKYELLPMFYSDLFDLGYEAVGHTNANMDIIVDWHTKYEEGVIYYLMEKSVRGVILWGMFGKVGAARELIARNSPVNPGELQGKITAKTEAG